MPPVAAPSASTIERSLGRTGGDVDPFPGWPAENANFIGDTSDSPP